MPKLTITARKSPQLQVMMGVPHVNNPSVPNSTATSITRYTHTQKLPAEQWTINHNLGIQPQITILSLGGMLMLAEILHVSTNQAIIYFDNPTAGIANCI